jgi:hypothetical protein
LAALRLLCELRKRDILPVPQLSGPLGRRAREREDRSGLWGRDVRDGDKV